MKGKQDRDCDLQLWRSYPCECLSVLDITYFDACSHSFVSLNLNITFFRS